MLFVAFVALAAGAVLAARPRPAAPAGPLSAASSAPVLLLASAEAALPAAELSMDAAPQGPRVPPFSQEPAENASAGATLADGAPVPALPADAPKQVSFGVILVSYRGAQGAAANARSRDDALALAKSIAEEAKKSFAQAALRGDVGQESAGTLPRGVLEPGPEYVLFGLPVGGVGGPVDSPKGFYVFKRTD